MVMSSSNSCYIAGSSPVINAFGYESNHRILEDRFELYCNVVRYIIIYADNTAKNCAFYPIDTDRDNPLKHTVMYKQHSLVMLPSKEKARFGNIILTPTLPKTLLIFEHQRCTEVAQHLYIVSDEEIKEGEPRLKSGDKFVFFGNNESVVYEMNCDAGYGIQTTTKIDGGNLIIAWSKCSNKIIATTDTSLNLPTISQSFITLFINEYNKGNVIDKVMVEYEHVCTLDRNIKHPCVFNFRQTDVTCGDNCTQSAFKLKLNSDNTIDIKPCKDSYTREELCEKLRTIVYDLYKDISSKERDGLSELSFDWTDKWIENNL